MSSLTMTNMSAAIKNVLTQLTINTDTIFAQIEEFPTTNFTGTPAATIIPSDNTSDYATIVQNFRTYAFFVDLFVPVKGVGGGYADAFATMRQLVDTALDGFDNSNDLNLNNTYGSSYDTVCDFLRPVPSTWAMVETNAGDMLTARITLQCAKTVNTDNG